MIENRRKTLDEWKDIQRQSNRIRTAPFITACIKCLIPVTSHVLHEFLSDRLTLSSVGYSSMIAFCRYQICPEFDVWKRRYRENTKKHNIDLAFLKPPYIFPMK